jgi:hypothetical protein
VIEDEEKTDQDSREVQEQVEDGEECGDGFECGHRVGWFRVERGGAACTLVLVYVSIRLSESE